MWDFLCVKVALLGAPLELREPVLSGVYAVLRAGTSWSLLRPEGALRWLGPGVVLDSQQ